MAPPRVRPRRPRPARRRAPRAAGSQAGRSAHRARPNLQLVEVDLPRDPCDHWLREATERWKLRVRLDLCRPVGGRPGRMVQLVELSGAPEALDAVERHLRRRGDTSEVTVIAVSPSRRFIRAVSTMPEGCRRVFESGAACLNCQLLTADGGDDTDRWTLVLPGTRRALRRFGRLRPNARGTEAQLLGVRRFVPRRTPTPRQAMAIEAAYRLGYYSFPRRVSLGQLARFLSVSRSTASELLRRAEGTMLARELGPSRR